MRLNFGKLEIHNFKSFLDETFNFSSMSGMTLVCGKNLDIPGQANSAGKSSIFDALLYALFGQLQTSVKNKNLRNRYAKDNNMEVILHFDIDKKRFFRINRGLNKYGQTFLKIVELVKDESGQEIENEISKSSVSETESFFENEIICCDVSIFLRTILLSSDQNYNFFLLSKGAKKDFIEKLFNISVFGEMYSLIHRDILNFEKEFSKKQTALLILNKSKSDFEERIEKYNETKNRNLDELKSKIEFLQKNMFDLQSNDISINKEELAKYENQINKLTEKKIEITNILKENSKNKTEILSKKIKVEAAKENEEKKIASYNRLLSKLCEKCKPIISEYYNLNKNKTNILKLQKELDSISIKYNEIEQTTTQLNEKTVKIDLSKELIDNKIHELTDKANSILLKISQVKSEIDFNKRNLEKLKNEENPYSSLYNDVLSNIEKENLAINEMNSKYSYLKTAENIVSQDTLKKFIIKDLVLMLNSKIKYYLMKLGAKYTCVFNEDMDYTFITPDNGGETEYATFSAGERMRLNIATSFAFRDFMSSRNNFMSNILILDEFIDSAIDTLAVTNILQLLQEFSRLHNQHVLIISHRKEIDNSMFDNIVMVEKQNNISKISYLLPEK